MNKLKNIFLATIFTALVSLSTCLATMIWAVDLPPDEYTLLKTRWLNWPEQEYYSRQNIELLIEGPEQITLEDYEQNTETYIASIKGKLIRFTR